MRGLALCLLLVFISWNAVGYISMYTTGDISTMMLTADQEENLPQGETETDIGSETYFHDVSINRELCWDSIADAALSNSTDFIRSFYSRLRLQSFFTPPEV